MRDWKRITRACLFEGLQVDVRDAMSAHINQHELGDILADSLMCVETASEKIKKGLPGRADDLVLVAAVITPDWLIWGIRGDRSGVTVMSARLADVAIQDYAATQFANMIPDTGIEVSGSFTAVSERGAAFLGLGEEPPARKFKQTVLEAAQAANK